MELFLNLMSKLHGLKIKIMPGQVDEGVIAELEAVLTGLDALAAEPAGEMITAEWAQQSVADAAEMIAFANYSYGRPARALEMFELAKGCYADLGKTEDVARIGNTVAEMRLHFDQDVDAEFERLTEALQS